MFQKTTSDTKTVKFKSTPNKDQFSTVLRKRMNDYFKQNNISRYGNWEMYLKTALAAIFWSTTYYFILNSPEVGIGKWGVFALFVFLGFINIFIAFNISHDACHNAYSSKPWVNQLMSYSLDFVGGNSYLFRQMHNVHHAFVNIHGIDVTMETHGLFRFTPHEKWLWYHRFQHIYTPILYMLAGVQWSILKDFKWFFLEDSIGNNKNIKHPAKEYLILFITKAIYFGLTLGLPMYFLPYSPGFIILCWFGLQIPSSLTFALIFQATHVYEGTHYPMPDEEGNIENNYAIHVVETTADFSRQSRIGNFLMGAINIHVIHHILPGICHVHYPKLTKILIKTCDDFGLKYKEHMTFPQAMKSHIKMLHTLSKPDSYVPEYAEVTVHAQNA